MIKTWIHLTVSLGLLAALPAISRAEDNNLLKPGASATAKPELPKLSPEELKAAGERATKAADKLGWRIGLQAWTFNRRSFFETLDQSQALGLHYIEAFPGQKVDKDSSFVIGPNMTPVQMEAVKKRLADTQVKLVSFGVAGIPRKPEEAKKLFQWAKDMGIENIVTESDPETLKAVAPIADDMGINVALHDHSRQVKSRYWSPELVLEATGSLSKRFGACADVGHWQRSDLDPTVSLKKLEGRIIELHFKDLNKRGEEGEYDVPWGTGTGNVPSMLDELKRQKVKPFFAIEYEHFTPGIVQDVGHSIVFFADECERLAK